MERYINLQELTNSECDKHKYNTHTHRHTNKHKQINKHTHKHTYSVYQIHSQVIDWIKIPFSIILTLKGQVPGVHGVYYIILPGWDSSPSKDYSLLPAEGTGSTRIEVFCSQTQCVTCSGGRNHNLPIMYPTL